MTDLCPSVLIGVFWLTDISRPLRLTILIQFSGLAPGQPASKKPLPRLFLFQLVRSVTGLFKTHQYRKLSSLWICDFYKLSRSVNWTLATVECIPAFFFQNCHSIKKLSQTVFSHGNMMTHAYLLANFIVIQLISSIIGW